MKCKECGFNNSQESKFCEKCGKPLTSQSEVSLKPSKKNPVRKIIIVIVSTILFIALGITIVLLATGNTGGKISSYLAAGQKYLLEMNYEQAIVEFDKIIAIDPNNAEAYLGKAEALFALGKDDEALDTLNKGYSLTKDEAIAEELGLNNNNSSSNRPATTTTAANTKKNTVTDAASQQVILPAPTGLKYTSDSNSISLRWNAVYGAFAYKVLIFDKSSGEFEEYKTVNVLSAKITDLNPSSDYRVKITTISNQNGFLCEGETTKILYCKTKEEIKLSAPTNIKWDSDENSVTLKWDKVPGADLYKIWICDDSNGEFSVYNVIEADSCLIDGLDSETEYKFRITTMTTANGVKEHKSTSVISCTTKEKKKEALQYVDASAYFKTTDILYGVADGKVVNVQGATEWDDPKKSFYVSDSLKCTKLDQIFPYGLYYSKQHYGASWETPELVHNSGTQYVYKATANGVKIIKKSQYPIYVTQDGYIAYYESRNNNYVVVNIESPTGETISSTTIYDYIDPVYIGYGAVNDRLGIYNGSKGELFRYTLYISDTGSRNEDVYYEYLFYDSGKVVLKEYSYYQDTDSYSCPDKLTHSGDTYLYGQVKEAFDNNIVIAEYYHSSFNPWDYIDFYVDPAYAAYALINTETGKASKLYKSIESADGKIFLATDFNGKKDYINKNGKKLAGGYDDAGQFIGNYSFVCKNGKYYIVDRNFNTVAEVNGTDVYVLGSNRFSCVKGNKVYLFKVNK